MESNVDLPQPDGPAIEMYSPFFISMCIPASACVSTSSVKKTFVTPSSRIKGWSDELMIFHSSKVLFRASVYTNARFVVPLRRVGKDNPITFFKALENLNRVDGTAAKL